MKSNQTRDGMNEEMRVRRQVICWIALGCFVMLPLSDCWGQERLPGFGPSKGNPRFSGFGRDAHLQALVSQADIFGAKTSMAKYDRNRDDVLSGSELTSTGWTGTLRNQIDRDGDERITLNEMAMHWTNSRLESARNARMKARSAAEAQKKKQVLAAFPNRPLDAVERQRLVAANSLANDLVKQNDRNGSKQLERNEWEQFAASFGDIGRADANNDDRINPSELSAWLLRRMGPAATWRLAKPLRLLDANGDGQISMHEYTTEWTEQKYADFHSIDVNRDGVISPTESHDPPTPVDSARFTNKDSRFINRRATVATSLFIENDMKIRDLDVRVAISKPSEEHMSILLVGPDGEQITLFAGGWIPWTGSYVFDDLLIDDEAPPIHSQQREAPFPRRLQTNAKPAKGKAVSSKNLRLSGTELLLSGQRVNLSQQGVIIIDGKAQFYAPPVVPATPPMKAPPAKDGEKTLKHYYGKSAKGEWKIIVSNRNDTVGLLREWSLLVTPAK